MPKSNHTISDEDYIIALCNKVLGAQALPQHTFDFLLGDPNKKGRCKKLPVDAYYEEFNLVIEYRERQHSESVKFFDRRHTISGVSRGVQRAIYDQRRREVLPQHGIHLIEFSYEEFQHTRNKRLVRDGYDDERIIRERLKKWIPS